MSPGADPVSAPALGLAAAAAASVALSLVLFRHKTKQLLELRLGRSILFID